VNTPSTVHEKEVWKLLRDPDVLVTALPGTKSLKQVGENEYEGELQVHIGPVAGTFGGRLTISNETPPEKVTLSVEGNGKIGFVKGSGDVTLASLTPPDPDALQRRNSDWWESCELRATPVRHVSRGMIEQGLDKLNATLKARDTAGKSG